MPRPEEEKLVRKHIYLFEQDWKDIEELYGKNIGASRAIRSILRRYLNGIHERVRQKIKTPKLDISDDDILSA